MIDIQNVVELTPNPNIPAFAPGDTVRVHSKVVESGRERTQVYEGVVIRIRRAGSQSSFTVRRVTHSVGIERTYLYHSPRLEKVEVTRRALVRRAKLYYLRELRGKAARLKEKPRDKR